MDDELGELRMRLRRLAAVAKLDLEPRDVDGQAALVARNGAVVALAARDAIAFPLAPGELEGLTGAGAGPRDGWTAVDAWQPELPAGEALVRLAAALRRAAERSTRG